VLAVSQGTTAHAQDAQSYPRLVGREHER
jgi:hypothetical protein